MKYQRKAKSIYVSAAIIRGSTVSFHLWICGVASVNVSLLQIWFQGKIRWNIEMVLELRADTLQVKLEIEEVNILWAVSSVNCCFAQSNICSDPNLSSLRLATSTASPVLRVWDGTPLGEVERRFCDMNYMGLRLPEDALRRKMFWDTRDISLLQIHGVFRDPVNGQEKKEENWQSRYDGSLERRVKTCPRSKMWSIIGIKRV